MAHNRAAPVSDGKAMDQIYRYQRFIYDVTRRYYLLGRNTMIAELDPPPGGTVLEVGCGTARNLIQAAATFPDAQFYGFDISSEMLKTAGRSVAASPHASRITLAQGDATTFDTQALFSIAHVDRIFVSYALSMIPGWPAMFDRAIASLSPEGSLHIVDFGRMDTMPGPARRLLLAWLQRFSVTPRRDLEAVCRAAADRHGLHLEFRDGAFSYWSSAVLKRM